MRILLHMCCGPCSIMPVTRLRAEGADVTGFFHNPNIHPLTEYFKRRESALATAKALDFPLLLTDAQNPKNAWDLPRWLRAVHDLREVPAGPASADRCAFCYRDRLLMAARVAKEQGFDGFCTSLLYSRMQRHESIQNQGEAAAQGAGIPFLYRDFRPDWQEGIDRSKELELYRQNYCGCIYSEAERFTNKLNKLQTEYANFV